MSTSLSPRGTAFPSSQPDRDTLASSQQHRANRRRHLWWLAAAVAAIAILAAACGGSSENDRADGGLNTQGGPAIIETGNSDNFRPADGSVQNGPPASGEDAARAPSAGGAQSYDPNALPALLDRQIIRTAIVTVNVDAVSQKFEEVSNVALGAGGFVSSSTFGNTGESQSASITIRVPADQYDATLRKLRGMGEVKEESSNANDVTEQYTDLQSRLRNLQASEQRYLDLLSRAETIDEILTVQDRTNATRAEIEQVQGRIQLLDNQSSLATITVHLVPPVAGAPKDDGGAQNPLEVAQEAWEASLAVLLGIATVAVAVVAFSWWLVPLAALGLWLGRRQLHNAP
jgi:hypothetical protein